MPDVTADREPDARFSLANERTFLAWNRTALALLAAGVGVTQVLEGGGRFLAGIPLIILGGVVGFFSYSRWRQVDEAMRAGDRLPPSALPRILTWTVALGAVVAVVLVVIEA